MKLKQYPTGRSVDKSCVKLKIGSDKKLKALLVSQVCMVIKPWPLQIAPHQKTKSKRRVEEDEWLYLFRCLLSFLISIYTTGKRAERRKWLLQYEGVRFEGRLPVLGKMRQISNSEEKGRILI